MKRTDLYILSYFYIHGREEVRYKEIISEAVRTGYYRNERSAYATLHRSLTRLLKKKYIKIKHDLGTENEGFRSYVITMTNMGYLAISTWWKKKLLAPPRHSKQ